jgi:hypothetical protein
VKRKMRQPLAKKFFCFPICAQIPPISIEIPLEFDTHFVSVAIGSIFDVFVV